MKRVIFVVDDKIIDVYGILSSLHAMLLRSLSPEEQNDTHISFLHVFWDSNIDAQNEYHRFFNREVSRVHDTVGRVGLSPFAHINYCPVVLKSEEYDATACFDMAGRVINIQKELLKNYLGQAAADSFPSADRTTFSYAVFLDIVLSLEKDRGYIREKKKVLSSCLYNYYPDPHCIVYTNYDQYEIMDNWMDIAGIAGHEEKMPVHRELLSRAHAISIKIRNSLYRALCIEANSR